MSVAATSGKTVAALDHEEVKRIAPTYLGDAIYSQTEVLRKRLTSSIPDRGIVKVRTTVTNQKDVEVMTLKRSFMVYTRDAALKLVMVDNPAWL